MSNPYQAHPNNLSIDPAEANAMVFRTGTPEVGMIYSDPNLYKTFGSQIESEVNQALSRSVTEGQTQPIWMRRLLSNGRTQVRNASNVNVNPFGGGALDPVFPSLTARPDLSLYSLHEAQLTQQLTQARSQAYEASLPGWGQPGPVIHQSLFDPADAMFTANPVRNLGPSQFAPNQLQISNVISDHASANSARAMMVANHMRDPGPLHVPNQLQISNVNADHDLTLSIAAQRLNAPTLNQPPIESNQVHMEPESKDIMSLPNEILYNVQTFLDHPSLLNLSATNKYFRSMCPDSKIKESLLCFEKCSLVEPDNIMARKTLLPCYTCFKALPAHNHFPEVENGDKYDQIEMASENAGRRTCATCFITKRPELILSLAEQHEDWLFQDYGWSGGMSKIFGARHNHSQHNNDSTRFWIHCLECQLVKRYKGEPYGRRRRYDEALLEGDMCADCYQPVWDKENQERRVRKNTKAKLRYKEKKLEAKRRKEEAEEARKAGRHFDSAMLGLGVSRFFQVLDGDTSRQSQQWAYGDLSDELTDFEGGPVFTNDEPYWT